MVWTSDSLTDSARANMRVLRLRLFVSICSLVLSRTSGLLDRVVVVDSRDDRDVLLALIRDKVAQYLSILRCHSRATVDT